MKKAIRSFATILLLFALTQAAFAGQMDTGVPTPPPPTAPGQMDTGAPAPGQVDVTSAIIVGETGVTDTLSEFALGIWKFLPSLL